ncbi:MAG: hypothetical protein HYY40_04465 [Bacteroidetes bacterium]|nr:hypothetical protein [Bacteroidota bacterium]
MSNDKLYDIVNWLNEQISSAGKALQDARDNLNYGKEVQCEGMVQAFKKCLEKLSPASYDA